jgi:hypothetical protein
VPVRSPERRGVWFDKAHSVGALGFDLAYVEQLVREMHSTATGAPHKDVETPGIAGSLGGCACNTAHTGRIGSKLGTNWRPKRLVRSGCNRTTTCGFPTEFANYGLS